MHLNLLKKKKSHEEVFLERYSAMLTWARNLSKSDPEAAEDIVQDAFIQFTLTAPDLSGIQNLDGYLYGLLRNLCVSRFRRETKNRLEQLSIYEYDSAIDGLETVDFRDQENARDELQRIISFLAVRKDSARTASVFILRFLHGYFPSEISSILRTSRPAVDVRLLEARREIRAYLESPDNVRWLHRRNRNSAADGIGDAVKEIFLSLPVQEGSSQDEFLSSLRNAIFKFCEEAHQTKNELTEFYEAAQPAAIEVRRLAHLVSCPLCLDEVNVMLKLPKLGSRFPTDSIGRDKKGRDDSGDGTGGSSLSRLKQKVQRVFEHKPNELRIVVNGDLQGSLKINAEVNELKLNLSSGETVEFVEIFSEQQVRLLMLSIDAQPPAGLNTQSAELTLSDDRKLEMHLDFIARGTELQILYRDPTYNEVSALLSNPAMLESMPAGGSLLTGTSTSTESRWQKWRTKFTGFALTPRFSVAALAVILISAIVFVNLPTRNVSASDLFRRSIALERSGGKVVNRRVTITSKVLESQGVATARTVDEWFNPADGKLVRRIYNANGELVQITRFENAKITRFTSKNVPPRVRLEPIMPGNLSKLNRAAESGLGVREFEQFIGGSEKATVEETESSYIVKYADNNDETKATLVLDKSTLRPVRKELEFDYNGKRYLYNFSEIGYETFTPGAFDQGVFEIDENFKEQNSRAAE